MRFAVALIVCAAAATTAIVAEQAVAAIRIQGRVTDRSGSVIPGVRVRLEVRGQPRETVTDNDGHYAFDGVDRAVAYVLNAELPGFQSQEYRGATDGDSPSIVNVDFSMPVGCNVEAQTVEMREPGSAVDRMLTASTIVHLRILEDAALRVTLDDDGCPRSADSAPVTVLGTVRSSRPPGKSLISVIVNRADSVKLKAGSEYLMFVEEYSFAFVSSHNMWRVKDGRLTEALDELGVPRGMPIGDALKRLREVYRQYTRYREFNGNTPQAHIGSLLLRSGWLPIGQMASRRNVWRHGEQEFLQPPFEFLSEVEAGRVAPRAGDRIRLKESGEFIIVDFSKTGEARLSTPPPSVRTKYLLPHQTGVVAEAGDVYRVDDVRFERVGSGRTVWVRLSLDEKRADQ